MKNKRIILTGMMGAGKTCVGYALSKKLNIPFFELDEIFERENNITIKDYFEKFSQREFRIKESEILKKTVEYPEFIISTGGGVILSEENRRIIFSDNIFSIYLMADSDEIYRRIKNNKTRPLLMVPNLKDEIEKILNGRKKYYEKANIIINTNYKTVDKITDEIELIWNKLK